MTKRKLFILVSSILAVELVGALSSLLTGDIKGQYAQMVKPPLAPPGSLVGIVWLILYFLMGVSLFLLITAEVKRQKIKTDAITLFIFQLLVNFIWSLIFFGGEWLWLGVAISLLLDALVLLCILTFRKVSTWAAYLFIPYVLWICFATYLSIGLAILN